MTEVEWLTCDKPRWLIDAAEAKASNRKVRLFACFCCRRVWDFLATCTQHAVEVNELFADGLTTIEELSAVSAAVQAVTQEAARAEKECYRRNALCSAFREGIRSKANDAVRRAPGQEEMDLAAPRAIGSMMQMADLSSVFSSLNDHRLQPYTPADDERLLAWLQSAEYERESLRCSERERLTQCEVVRCILGNPFRSSNFDVVWRTPAVVSVAKACYEERAFPSGKLDHARLGELADALEDAGCADVDFLGHLRSSGVHVRGCWPLELLLGKE